MSINGSVALAFNFNDARTVGTGTPGNLPINPLGVQAVYSNGAGANQVNQIYGVNGTFSGTTAVLDLNTGLADNYGSNVVLVRFKALLIWNTSALDAITVGGGSNPIVTWLGVSGTMILPPGAATCNFAVDATGWVVTASTACNILLTGTSGQTYTVAVAGSTT